MKKDFCRVALMLLMTLLSSATAWADSTFGGGDGTASNPYIISTLDHWNQLSADVAAGKTYSGKYFQMDDDIDVGNKMVGYSNGKSYYTFNGIFDGNGHTLTVGLSSNDDWCAPFAFTYGATIKNLATEGTISTGGRYAGGVVGRNGTANLTLTNVKSSVTITSAYDGQAFHGGLVGYTINATLTGCAFDGKLKGSSSKRCGGLVGWKTSTSGSSIMLNNCVFAPSEVTIGSTGSYPFIVNNGYAGFNNCYYLSNAFGTSQGKQAHSITVPEGITIVPTGNATEFNTSGITVYDGNPCLKYNNVLYAGSSDVVKLTFTHGFTGSTASYSVGEGISFNKENDIYTLTMPDADVNILVNMTAPGLVGDFQGSGTADTPYLISNEEDWNKLVTLVNNGKGEFASAYYKIDDQASNITVTTMLGNSTNRFKGHFDGNGKTLTVSYDNLEENYTAPFRYVEGVTIENLHVAGTINTASTRYAAGLIAYSAKSATSETTIKNCRVSVTITSTVNGDGTHAGFVSNNSDGTLNIEGCVFDGSLLGSNTNNCAGFVGWNETRNDNAQGKVKITNSLFAPKATEMVIQYTFSRSRSFEDGVITLQNCYCTADYRNNQQVRVYSITADDGVNMTYNGGAVTNSYNVSGLAFYNTGLKFDGVLHAKSGDQLNLTLSNTGTVQGNTFSTTSGELSLYTDNTYTLTMSNGNATISVDLVEAWTGTGTGVEGDPYIINSTDLWNEFATKVNDGKGNFPTAYYKLEAGITVTTMAGTEARPFKGHFDGGGKTLTFNHGTESAHFDEEYCAPFRYINGADIHDLHVAGTIYTEKKFAAGIVGKAVGNNAINTCRSSITINSSVDGDGTHGGLVAIIEGSTTTITNCAFFGSLLGSTTDRCGGFVGWTNGSSATISNCLFAPASVTVDASGSATFSRGNSPQISDCYFTNALGTVQGTLVYATAPTGTPYATMNLFGTNYYLPMESPISNITANDITPSSATISWKGSDGCSDYRVRYRECNAYLVDFEKGLPDGWTTIDADGDGHNWYAYNNQDLVHSGEGGAASDSYLSSGLTPDNWLISPQLELGGTLRVWLRGVREDYYQEHFAIYLSTTGNSQADFTVTLVPEQETTYEYKEYTADLSSYAGQQGYIAIRHYNCEDVYTLMLDDFEVIIPVESGEWTTIANANAEGTTIADLESNTTYEYQVFYKYQNVEYHSSSSILTTRNDLAVPANLSADHVTQNTAYIGWTGYAKNYNLRYIKYESTSETALVTLNVPNDVWEDGTGYQMLLDKDHDTFGSVIPEEGALTERNDNSAAEKLYANFEYKIPEGADGALTTSNIVCGTEKTIEIPAGMYDWCITNPTPGDRVWIASGNGNVGGRKDDFVFEPGKYYTFTVTLGGSNDCVDMSVSDIPGSANREWTTVNDIEGTSYSVSGLTPGSLYQVQVQSVKDDKQSEWSDVFFTTADASNIGLADNADNSEVLTTYNNQVCDVTLAGRTLYKDDNWNTLCLPFDVDLNAHGCPLARAEVRTLSGSSFKDGTLTLEFTTPTSSIVAGTPYIIKWGKPANYVAYDGTNAETTSDIVNPVFPQVTISNTVANVEKGCVKFIGFFSPYAIEGKDVSTLFLGADSKLYFPNAEMTIGSCRARFSLIGLNAGEASGVRSIELNFGDEETGISSTTDASPNGRRLYDLQGRQLRDGAKKGLHIANGRIVFTK